MPDQFTSEKRSEIMSKVHSTDTTPELYVRKLLHGMGYRFRLHNQTLPGKPDLVLAKHKAVIFVNGCFWHGCPTYRHAQIRPKANSAYWNKKLDRTIQRDKENIAALKRLGWRVLIIWECETRIKNQAGLCEKINTFFN
jgi:DNA mismatch endonuclease (patch repair protein)